MNNLLADDDPRLETLCRIGCGPECCRWLARGRDGYFCAKLDPTIAPHIAWRYIRGQMGSRGDNCPGLAP